MFMTTPRIPLFWLSLAFITGLLTAGCHGPMISILFFLAVLAICLTPNIVSKKRSGLLLLLMTGALGQIHMNISQNQLKNLISETALLSIDGPDNILFLPVIRPSDQSLLHETSAEVCVWGWVSQAPQPAGNSLRFQLYSDSLSTAGQHTLPIRQRFVVYADSLLPPLVPGHRIVLAGRLKPLDGPRNPGAFDYRSAMARQGIHYRLYTKSWAVHADGPCQGWRGRMLPRLHRMRCWCRKQLQVHTSKLSAPLLIALLLGQRDQLDDNLTLSFANTGLVHFLAVSGLHVGVITAILVTLTGCLRIRSFLQLAVILPVLWGYAALTGGQPSVLRAATMATVWLLGRCLHRRGHLLNTLGVAAIIHLLHSPQDLLSLGFQFSFLAALGIALFHSRTKQFLERHIPSGRFSRTLVGILAASLSAQLLTWPLTVQHFNRLSLISLPANLLMLPWLSLLIPLGMTTLVCAGFSPFLASTYGAASAGTAELAQWIITQAGQWDAAALSVPSTGWITWIFYGLLLTRIYWPDLQRSSVSQVPTSLPWVRKPGCTNPVNPQPRIHRLFRSVMQRRPGQAMASWIQHRPDAALLTAFLLLANISIWKDIKNPDSPHLQYIQFDVGQGDAALLSSMGRHWLVDGGPISNDGNAGDAVLLPYFRREGIRHLQAVVLTHAHDDHLGGLAPVMQTLIIDTFYTAIIDTMNPQVSTLLEIARKRRIIHVAVKQSRTVNWPGVALHLMPPDSTSLHANNRSLALRCCIGSQALLLPGDLEQRGERYLIEHYPVTSQTVKAAHHGAATSSCPGLMYCLSSSNVILSLGRGNRFGHPHPSVVDRWQQSGANIFRTDLQGAIVAKLYADTTLIRPHLQ